MTATIGMMYFRIGYSWSNPSTYRTSQRDMPETIQSAVRSNSGYHEAAQIFGGCGDLLTAVWQQQSKVAPV
jgi:hypothetical protein